MNPFKMYQTDPDLEVQGIDIDYGDFYFTIARAGGANKRFNERLAEAFKPYRRAIQTETADVKLLDRITKEVFIQECIKGWGSTKHGPGKMLNVDDSPLDYTPENVALFFGELPELLDDLVGQANKMALYRAKVIEDDLGN